MVNNAQIAEVMKIRLDDELPELDAAAAYKKIFTGDDRAADPGRAVRSSVRTLSVESG